MLRLGCARLWLILIVLSSNLAAHEMQIRMRSPQGPNDSSHSYFIGLVQLALNKTINQGPAKIILAHEQMPQDRALHELSKGKIIDLDWAGSSREREQLLHAIRIPLLGGLLGHRALVIRKTDQAKLDKINTLEELAKLRGLQGSQWPDTRILRSAGLNIEAPHSFEFMYPMLISGRADYFPRALTEAYAEVNGLKRNDLMVYDRLLIVYPLPMYFFTSKRNTALAQRIEQGLTAAVNDGSLLEYMKHHPVTAPVFPLSKYRDATLLKIDNTELPPETPINNPKLWLQIE